jgi:NADH:ubiquinone oxidoreductase subunit E
MNRTGPSKPEQYMDAEIDYTALYKIIKEDFYNDTENLIMIIQAIQRRYNYLPEPALKYIAATMGVPLSRIYGVATFYSTFSLEPRGRNIISICLGTACHVRGGERIRERIEGSLNIKDGETTDDRRFTFETVRCIGCCSLGPVVKINEDVHGHISSDQVEKIMDRYE